MSNVFSSSSGFFSIGFAKFRRSGPIGVVAAGITYQKLLTALGGACPPQLSILQLSTFHPFPKQRALDWLRARAAAASIVTSVCTGSGLLAKAGLLDGLRATSNKRAFEWAEAQSERVRWVREARWVEDGRFFTSSGVSAGIDMSLAVIGKLLGDQRARDFAAWAEYEWNEEAGRDPFAGPHDGV